MRKIDENYINTIYINKGSDGYYSIAIYDDTGYYFTPTLSGHNVRLWKTEKGALRYIDKFDREKRYKVIKRY